MSNATLISGTKLVLLTEHAAVSADVNGTGVDMLGAKQAVMLFKLGTTTGTSATVRVLLQESSDNSSFSTIGTSATVALDAGAGTGATFAVQAATHTKRYIRYAIDVAGTSPVCGDVLVCILTSGHAYSRETSDYTVTLTA